MNAKKVEPLPVTPTNGGRSLEFWTPPCYHGIVMVEPLTKEYLDEKFDKFADTVQRGFHSVREQMDARFTVVDQTLGRISATVADLKVGREEDTQRLRRLEESAERVYNRIDEFIVIIQRQEAEVAALRMKVERFEERLARVETSRSLQPA